MRFSRALSPRPPQPLRVEHISDLILDSTAGSAVVDGKPVSAKLGRWMFYLPALQLKLFHAADGHIDCTSSSRPAHNELQHGDRPAGRYQMKDWRNALETPISRRLAEIWLVSVRLWQAGIGPQPLGVCFVKDFVRDGCSLGPTCGLITENVYTLPRKLKCTLEQIHHAGVVPDRILSCVRQQLRGYVVDLCSVVGCVPVGAEAEVNLLDELFRCPTSEPVLRLALEETFAVGRQAT